MHLSDLVADLATTALFVDYDGTLAPIVDDPAEAAPAEGAIGALTHLVSRGTTVTVVSGRPAEFLCEMTGTAPVDLIGVYGLERIVGGIRTEVPEAETLRGVMTAIERELATVGPGEMIVENKGMSITLHYRKSPRLGGEVAALAAAVADRWPVDVRAAKQSFELHPEIDVDKGSAILDVVRSEQSVVYIGDDEGDLAAFAALDLLEARGRDVVRVAVGSAELPEALEIRADVVLDGPAGVVNFLSGS